MDAIAFLKQEHKTIEALFGRFERAPKKQKRARKKTMTKIVEELASHADLEEQIFYPIVHETTKEADPILKAMEEHDLVKGLMSELSKMEPEEDRFEAKSAVLLENSRHHIKEEERTLLPMIRRALKKGQLDELGSRLEEAKKAMRKPKDYLKTG
jgi:hemerythrin-like domain-containing protein